ncbi:MAG: cysteine desulfurase [Lewinellaceae bacterium]|nr:cysteine desulfurase [Lewinellaceae bacterium]
MQRIYFDNAATTSVDEAVLATMMEALRELSGNPSSIYAEGRKARAAIEGARKLVAHHVNASIGEIFFTSGGTESSNMALKGAVRDLGVQRIISSRTEHHCVLHSLDALEAQGVQVDFVTQDEKGIIQLDHLESLLQAGDAKTLVSLMHANNEIGTMIDLGTVGQLCQQYGAYFHTDTVQTIGYFPIDLAQTPISFLTGSAHKFHGPKGCGFIYINQENQLKPFIDGGSQERNMRGGTENTAGILGLAKALDLAYSHLEERAAHIRDVRDYFRDQLLANFEDIEFNGDPFGASHYKVLSVAFPPSPQAELLLFNLDVAGISVSGGSACSSGADAGSHVLNALKKDSPRQTIRFSFSHHNTREEVDRVIAELQKILKKRPSLTQ